MLIKYQMSLVSLLIMYFFRFMIKALYFLLWWAKNVMHCNTVMTEKCINKCSLKASVLYVMLTI